jgi:uncharacterized membrane protein YcaP (DUF421 family)
MKPEDIKLNDWQRIFAGQVPAEFYFELAIRAFIIFFLLVFCMRLLGKRMTGHISQLELVALVSLASAIGVPMLAPDRGLLPALIIAAIVVGVTRLISRLGYKNEHFEKLSQGKADSLVKDAVMQYQSMQRVRISRERLFAHLRSEGIKHLGQVKRVYLETNGVFTIIPSPEKNKPGLMTLPAWDKEFVTAHLKETAIVICKNCGKERNGSNHKCENCHEQEWVNAVVETTAH